MIHREQNILGLEFVASTELEGSPDTNIAGLDFLRIGRIYASSYVKGKLVTVRSQMPMKKISNHTAATHVQYLIESNSR